MAEQTIAKNETHKVIAYKEYWDGENGELCRKDMFVIKALNVKETARLKAWGRNEECYTTVVGSDDIKEINKLWHELKGEV